MKEGKIEEERLRAKGRKFVLAFLFVVKKFLSRAFDHHSWRSMNILLSNV